MYKAEMVYNRNDARKFFIKGPKSSVRKFIDGFAIGIAVLMTIILMLALAGGAPLWGADRPSGNTPAQRHTARSGRDRG